MTVLDSLGAAGTIAYAGTRPPTRRFIASVLLAGAAATGTVPVLSVADALALRHVEAASRTLPSAPNLLRAGERAVDVSARLQRIRRLSGLSWSEVALAVGVSRRSVHNWLRGARVASVHLARLAALEGLVESFAGAPASEARDRILQPGSGGETPLAQLAQASRPARNVPTSPLTLTDMVTPVADATAVDGKRRSSALRGQAVRRRPSTES